MKKVIFVCTGNTCRSPMAEVIAKKIFDENKIGVQVFSRGVSVFFESGASNNAKEAVKKYGLNLSSHLSKQITQDDIDEGTLILAMTDGHKDFLLSGFASSRDKIYTLKNYVGCTENDIADPFGQAVEVYSKCCDDIYSCIVKLSVKIRNDSRGNNLS